MSFDALIAATQRLNASVEGLAALGAHLRLEQAPGTGNPEIRARVRAAVEAIAPDELADVDGPSAVIALGFIEAFFRQALDLFENPGREPGWVFEDESILQAQGRASRLLVVAIAACALERPDLAAVLARGGRFLDIGTGVGWLAIEAARVWPAMRVVGIDPFPAALALARRNLDQTDLAGRVELRLQGVESLDDIETYDLAFVPTPFLPSAVFGQALARLRCAMRPGGQVVVGLYAAPPGPLPQALAELRIARSGGYPWTPDEAAEKLRDAGFLDPQLHAPGPPLQIVVATQP